MPHHVLVAIAIELGYPLVLLRHCLASYRLKRSIGVEGVFSETVVATRGITAGSGTAATELKLLLLPFMKMLELQWSKTLVAKVYVDDRTLIVRGIREAMVKQLTEIMNSYSASRANLEDASLEREIDRCGEHAVPSIGDCGARRGWHGQSGQPC